MGQFILLQRQPSTPAASVLALQLQPRPNGLRAPWFLAAALVVATASPAAAQGIGLQGGVSVDPEQLYIGSHVETGELWPRFHFRPGIDGGFGDNLSLASINVEFLYRLPFTSGGWTFYQGGGPAVILLRQRGDRSIHAGTFFTVGFGHRNGFFTEIKIGSGNSPTLKFGAGYLLRTRTP